MAATYNEKANFIEMYVVHIFAKMKNEHHVLFDL